MAYKSSSAIKATHAFTTRAHGASLGIYASLNFGLNLGDDPNCVRRNYEILGTALDFDPQALVLSRQVHGTRIRLVTKADRQSPFEPVPTEADGLITAEADVPLVIFTADCVPILLYDPVRGAVGAVHAGWRGTVADIVGNAVSQMAQGLDCRPSDIRAAIGPCISACCFETGDDVNNAVNKLLGSSATHYVTARGEKFMVDLKGINRFLLKRAGIKPSNIDVSPDCTACLNKTYWSHRITKGKRGSQVSVIMLKGTTH